MNFTQLQERLRDELHRRIGRGELSVSLLAQKSGLTQGHISNFLGGRSMRFRSLDKIVDSLGLDLARLAVASSRGVRQARNGEFNDLPVVSHGAAMLEKWIEPASVGRRVPVRVSELAGALARGTRERTAWQRFVAIEVNAEDAAGMGPVVRAGMVLIVDRHYNSFHGYPKIGEPEVGVINAAAGQANLYAVRVNSRLVVRYAEYSSGRMILRAYEREVPLTVVAVQSRAAASELLVGRVAFVWGPGA